MIVGFSYVTFLKNIFLCAFLIFTSGLKPILSV